MPNYTGIPEEDKTIKDEDLDYETESDVSSEEYSDREVQEEEIIVKKDNEGFVSIS